MPRCSVAIVTICAFLLVPLSTLPRRPELVNIEESTLTDSTRFLTSAQAAARLGVKPATLYAYVSRGLLVRHKASDGRTSLFDPTDIARLQNRSRARHSSPTDVVVASELTLVAGDPGRLWYRGLDPLDACRTHRFEEVAGWLWSGREAAVRSWRADAA